MGCDAGFAAHTAWMPGDRGTAVVGHDLSLPVVLGNNRQQKVVECFGFLLR